MLNSRFQILTAVAACLMLVAGCAERPQQDLGELAGDITEAEIAELRAISPQAIGDDFPALEVQVWTNREFTPMFSDEPGQGQVVVLDVWDQM